MLLKVIDTDILLKDNVYSYQKPDGDFTQAFFFLSEVE
jgi:hypothetical protein